MLDRNTGPYPNGGLSRTDVDRTEY